MTDFLLLTHIRVLHNLAKYVRNWATVFFLLEGMGNTTTWNFQVVNALDNFEKAVVHYALFEPIFCIIVVKWKVISMSYTYIYVV